MQPLGFMQPVGYSRLYAAPSPTSAHTLTTTHNPNPNPNLALGRSVLFSPPAPTDPAGASWAMN